MVLWIVIFVILWLITFLPAWKMLLWLSAYSAGKDSLLDAKFISIFVGYRFIILAPYLWLVIAGEEYLSNLFISIIFGFLLTGFFIAFVRFFLRDKFVSILWQVYARVYDSLLSFYPYSSLVKKVAKLANTNGGRVLDLGAGTGNVSKLLNNYSHLTLVDSSSVMLKKANKKLKSQFNVAVVQSDLEQYVKEYQGDKLDTVIMNNSLYVVENRNSFWQELSNIVKPGAKIIISNSDKTGSIPIIKEHISHKGFVTLLNPRLVTVFIIDQLISSLSSTGTFSFVSYDYLVSETKEYFKATFIERCYGGPVNGVNILFILEKR